MPHHFGYCLSKSVRRTEVYLNGLFLLKEIVIELFESNQCERVKWTMTKQSH